MPGLQKRLIPVQQEKKCPRCGGVLSEIRNVGKYAYRHCTGCQYNYPEKDPRTEDLPQGCFDDMA